MRGANVDHLILVLIQELERRRLRNAKYSLRAFARDLSISPGELSKVLSGKKEASNSFIIKVLKSGLLSYERASLVVDSVFSNRKDRLMRKAFPQSESQSTRPLRTQSF